MSSLECLPRSGYKDFHLEFSKRRFCFICSAQVKRLLRIRPKYLTLVTDGIILFDRKMEGNTFCLKVKVICDDFSLFIFIFHLDYRDSMSLIWLYKCWLAIKGLSFEVKMILSSANSVTEVYERVVDQPRIGYKEWETKQHLEVHRQEWVLGLKTLSPL